MVSEENLCEPAVFASIGTCMIVTNESIVTIVRPGRRSTGAPTTDEHAADRTTRIVHVDERRTRRPEKMEGLGKAMEKIHHPRKARHGEQRLPQGDVLVPP